jgi:hypoxanthine phosphoribosyltransferase
VKVLLSADHLREGISRLASEVRNHYGDQPLTVIGVLTGSLVLIADLIRQLDMPVSVGVVQARSYRGDATSPGPLSINTEMLPEIEGHHVLLVDDIFDTGQTLAEFLDWFAEKRPASVRSLVLLRKADRGNVSVQPDHVGFEIPNEFVVGSQALTGLAFISLSLWA